MDIKDYLLDEMKRLNRLNDKFEKEINTRAIINNEPEQIACNVKTMCKIADAICNLHSNGII